MMLLQAGTRWSRKVSSGQENLEWSDSGDVGADGRLLGSKKTTL